MSGENAWEEKLFGCTDDCGTCCYGCWCAPCLFGSNYEKVADKNCCLMCCIYLILGQCYLCWIPQLFERQAFRKKYNLQPEPCDDCPTALCCGPCALCQEAREMKTKENKQAGVVQANGGSSPVIVMQPQSYKESTEM